MSESSGRFLIRTVVRQDSVEGPVLFILYLAALTDAAFPHNSAYRRDLGVELLFEDGDITDTKRFKKNPSRTGCWTAPMWMTLLYLPTQGGGGGGGRGGVREGAGGQLAQVTIEDQKKWDGKGSPPGAVENSGTPLPSTLLTDLQTDLTVLCVVYAMFVSTVVLGALKSSLMAKGFPRINKISNPIQLTQIHEHNH